MRISDWSSDVCSSDLQIPRRCRGGHAAAGYLLQAAGQSQHARRLFGCRRRRSPYRRSDRRAAKEPAMGEDARRRHLRREWRSEEHTSELQSLMRISYAVFCLKKKKHEQEKTDQETKRQETKTQV